MFKQKQLKTKSVKNKVNVWLERRKAVAMKRAWSWRKRITRLWHKKRVAYLKYNKLKNMFVYQYYHWASPRRWSEHTMIRHGGEKRMKKDSVLKSYRLNDYTPAYSGRYYRRRKKRDWNVSFIWRNGKQLRRITKLGGRKIYRPVKLKFPNWWKLSNINKRNKQRRSDKKIYGFRWLYRARNSIESRFLRRRKFYSRQKRALDYVAWKFYVSKSILVGLGEHKQKYTKLFNQSNYLNNAGHIPLLSSRYSHRLSVLADWNRYGLKKSNRKIGLVQKLSSSTNNVNLWFESDYVSVNIMRYPFIKRYRKRTIKKLSGIDYNLNINQKRMATFEKRLNYWRNDSWLYKQRLNVMNRTRYTSFLTRGK